MNDPADTSDIHDDARVVHKIMWFLLHFFEDEMTAKTAELLAEELLDFVVYLDREPTGNFWLDRETT